VSSTEAPPEPTLAITPMRPGDIDAVMEIERLSFRTPWSAQVFLDEIGRAGAFVDVLRSGGGVFGFVNFWHVADEIHLLNVAVHPSARRQGHARRLLDHVIAFARQHGCRIVTLEARRSNEVALRLYESAGFRSVAVRPNYYADDQEDAIVMIMDL
jgi:ribosomal-protein-alanine N-acetyltransferase